VRHVTANRVAYVIATVLVLSALLFGYLRSRAIVIETERDASQPAVVRTLA